MSRPKAEQVELTEPWKAIEQAGSTPELVSTEVGKIQAFNHLTAADTFGTDKAADSVSSAGYVTLSSSRKPDDLPAFCHTLVGAFAKDNS